MRKFVILGAAIAAALAGSAAAQPSGRERITLYEGPNFTGRSVTYDHDISNLPREFQDRAISVRIVGSWRLCSDSDYRGRCVDIDRDIADLGRLDMDLTISSMRNTGPVGGGGGGRPGGGYPPGGGGGYPGGGGGGGYGDQRITIYEGADFTGRSATFTNDMTNLPQQFKDMARSIRIQGRGAWSVCVDSDYRGRCVTIDRDVRDLRPLGMDRTISSMRATRSGGGGGYPGGGGGGGYPGGGGGGWGGRNVITLYDGPDFTGRSRTFDSDFTNLPREFNDTAGSVRVQGRWTACVDSSYRGRCVTIDRDIRDLRSIGMDRTISSIRAERYGRP